MDNRFVASSNDFQQLSLCPFCRHKTLGKPTCAAFPKAIPADILSGAVKHTKPIDGDKGIVFERDESVDPSIIGNVK
jgi:hypothetical protein